MTTRRRSRDNIEGAELYHEWWKLIRSEGIPGFEGLPKHAVIPELNNVNRFKLIYQALERARYRSSDIERIMGGNWLRVLKEVLG